MTTIRCTSTNSTYTKVHDNPNVSWIVRATKHEHDLFCYVGTDIFVHDVLAHYDFSSEGKIKCPRAKECPICANRQYLESLGELQPRVTGDERIDKMLAMNYDYCSSEPFWVRNWLVLRAEFIVKHTPKCSKCGQIIETGWIFGCDSWVKRIRKGICYDCDEQYQAETRRLEREYSPKPKRRKIKEHDAYSLGSSQKGLEEFLKASKQ